MKPEQDQPLNPGDRVLWVGHQWRLRSGRIRRADPKCALVEVSEDGADSNERLLLDRTHVFKDKPWVPVWFRKLQWSLPRYVFAAVANAVIPGNRRNPFRGD